jgi:hypothetical protein
MNTLTLNLKYRSQDDDAEYWVIEICIDGEILADFDFYTTDLGELICSTQAGGEFFIITCTCGVAGCAGIYKGIKVQHAAGNILWNVVQPLAQPRQFIFERNAYEQAIRDCIRQGQQLIAQRKTLPQKPLEIIPVQNESLFFRENNLPIRR